MRLTIEIAMENLKNILKEKAPVRVAYEKNGRVYNGGPVGKPGTNMYSPYPGNLKNNGKVEQIFVDNPDFFKTINWEVMKYLLEIHKNKKLTNKISLKDLKQNENKIKNTLDQLQQM